MPNPLRAMDQQTAKLYQFSPPYVDVVPLPDIRRLPSSAGIDGTSIVWCMSARFAPSIDWIATRPTGVALVMVLPPRGKVQRDDLLAAVEATRPAAVLPYHPQPAPSDVRVLLREPPPHLAAQVVDFLIWRGNSLPTDGRRLLTRTIELSRDLRSVSALARALHVSRRALGRRFADLRLPVPSHCLHFGRLLQAHLLAQFEEANLSSVANELGYPDAFAMSNQMARLLGIRPSTGRRRLGWEWMVECWLRREGLEAGRSALGGLAPERKRSI
jgi:AraC-like DNA-binding protein